MDGRQVKAVNLQSGLNYISISVPAGIYFLRFGEAQDFQQFKVVIK